MNEEENGRGRKPKDFFLNVFFNLSLSRRFQSRDTFLCFIRVNFNWLDNHDDVN